MLCHRWWWSVQHICQMVPYCLTSVVYSGNLLYTGARSVIYDCVGAVCLCRQCCRCQRKCSRNSVGRTLYRVSRGHVAPLLLSTHSFCWNSCWWTRRSAFLHTAHTSNWPCLHTSGGQESCSCITFSDLIRNIKIWSKRSWIWLEIYLRFRC